MYICNAYWSSMNIIRNLQKFLVYLISTMCCVFFLFSTKEKGASLWEAVAHIRRLSSCLRTRAVTARPSATWHQTPSRATTKAIRRNLKVLLACWR